MASISQIDPPTEREIFYYRQRFKNRIYQSVIAHFAKWAMNNGLNKRILAERLGKDPAQITRWFSGPSNWTLDTISDLLLVMRAEMSDLVVPLDTTATIVSSTSDKRAQWFSDDIVRAKTTTPHLIAVRDASVG